MESNEDITYESLYPSKTPLPMGLPADILKMYEIAEQIKHLDAGIYAMTLRKVLELVCHDKKAEGRWLINKLQDLTIKGEIPRNLVMVVDKLKDYGNFGAHEATDTISPEEIPMIEALCKAVLEYMYTAPYLAALAEKKVNAINNKKSPK